MSGIAGIVNFDGAPVEPGRLETMTSAMSYRGPDGIAHWHGSAAALGHCMLHTTPESLEERQPITSEDGSLVLVMDGRVDNCLALRRDLLGRGITLRNRSDAELVLRAYQLWGRECLSHVEGDFALAIWNTLERNLFCARDPMGIKPFIYYWTGSSLVFASDVHAILALPGVPQVLNEGVLAEYLACEWYSRDETFWRGILRLVAAQSMVVDASGPRIHHYWTPDLFTTLNYRRDEEYVEHYLELFTDTVKRLSRSHKPVAAEVSGGLDSSAIFAVAEDLRVRGRLNAPDLAGYTLDFTGDPGADEIEYCRAVGEKLNKSIVEVPPAYVPLAWYRESARRNKGFPGHPNGIMVQNLMQQVSDSGSRVLLDGLGGDEWLSAGRSSCYQEELWAARYSQLMRLFKSDVRREGVGRSSWWLLRSGLAGIAPEIAKEFLRKVRDRRETGPTGRDWLSPELQSALAQQQARSRSLPVPRVRWPGQRGELQTLTNAFTTTMHEFKDSYSATFGLEGRRPFCTPRMVQFSFMVPKRLLFGEGEYKFIHRRAMRGLLPQRVISRQTKAEFSVSYRQYLPEMRELLTHDIPLRRPSWVDQKQVCTIFESYKKEYTGPSMWLLWGLFGCDSMLD